MNRGWLLVVALLGCREGLARNREAESAGRGPATASGGGAAGAPAPATSQGSQQPATYVTEAEVRGLAAKVTALKGGRLLVCGDAENTANCVCLEPLACGQGVKKDGKDGCLTFERNLEVFRASLAGKEKGRKVDCRRAEVGSCGGFRYFAFNGDIERNDLSWFDSSGALVAARSATDYPAYCGGKARIRFQGRVPSCGPMKRDELLCGTDDYPLPRPIEDVLKRPMPLEEGSAGARSAPAAR